MKEIFTETKLTNYGDLEAAARGFITEKEVRSISRKGKIDTGAAELVISKVIAQTLGLRIIRETGVEYADGRKVNRPVASAVDVEINGRSTVTTPIIGESDRLLVGNPIFEAMDYLIDTVTGELLPRHPESPLPVVVIDTI